MALNLSDLFASLEGFGFFEIALPFLLVFTLVFAILQRVQILGGEKRINGIVAAILGLLVIRNAYVVGLIHRLLPNVSLIIVVIIMILLIIGIFLGGAYSGLTGGFLGFVVLASIFLVLWALGSDYLGVDMPYWLSNIFTRAGIETLFFVIGFILVVAFILGVGGRQGGGSRNPLKIIGDGLSQIGSGFGRPGGGP